jgi:hypothetical protein
MSSSTSSGLNLELYDFEVPKTLWSIIFENNNVVL